MISWLNICWCTGLPNTLHYMSFSGRFYPKGLTVDQTKQETYPLEQGLAQGPNSCADIIVAKPGIEPPTKSSSLTSMLQAALHKVLSILDVCFLQFFIIFKFPFILTIYISCTCSWSLYCVCNQSSMSQEAGGGFLKWTKFRTGSKIKTTQRVTSQSTNRIPGMDGGWN